MTDKEIEVLELMKSTKGRIFSIHFYKKNGELRKMAARINVQKGVIGTGMSYDPNEYGLKPVFSMNDNGWRTVTLDNTTYFKCGKTEVRFDTDE